VPKRKRETGNNALDALLAWLDPDKERAAAEYVRLHLRLTKMFEARGCSTPEECADETFSRVGRQLLEGKEIRTDNPIVYIYGVARFVLLEQWSKPMHENLEDVAPDKLGRDGSHDLEYREEKDRQHACLEECLRELPTESRILVLEYYAEDKTLKIDTRNRMARSLGIAASVLRNRIFKLRNNLRTCVAACLAR
jgi:DNA-directed RNA polymerase specialized sigma24 family protein